MDGSATMSADPDDEIVDGEVVEEDTPTAGTSEDGIGTDPTEGEGTDSNTSTSEGTTTSATNDNGEPSANTRVKMAAWLSRNASRATKRAVAAGKATGRGAKAVGLGAVRQITMPYTATKVIAFTAAIIGLYCAVWYYTFVATIVTAVLTGSWVLAIIAGLGMAWLLSRWLLTPMLLAYMNYCSRAMMHDGRAFMASFGRRNAPKARVVKVSQTTFA